LDIQIVKTGRIVYKVDGTLAVLLIEAFPEHFTRYEKPAPPPVEPSWRVVKLLSGKLVLQYQHGAFTSWFQSSPGRICEWVKTLPADAGVCPEAIRAEYAARYTPDVSGNL
jgi:hypothetical protein